MLSEEQQHAIVKMGKDTDTPYNQAKMPDVYRNRSSFWRAMQYLKGVNIVEPKRNGYTLTIRGLTFAVLLSEIRKYDEKR